VRAVLTDTGRYAADMVILAVGVAPNVDLAAAAGLELGETGAIATDATMCTSDPDIYAVGDCAETKHAVTGVPCNIPLGSTAMRQGRVAAVNICGGDEKFPGVVGTMICKVFDYCVGRTGLGEAEALSRGFSPISVLAPGPDRAHYVPGAARLLSKLIVDQSSRRVLGLQVVGDGFGCKRVDVAAACITAGMTVDDLANMDLGYAPPFATAIDNIMTAANVARNRLSGHFASLKPLDVWNKLRAKEPCTLLDVRSREEYEQFHLPTSVLIPLGGLRDRLTEVPVNGEIILYSELSLRAYEASLILRSAGFDNVKVMEGGLAMWPYEGMA
jgi:rhodanese-related sulfurtransferase